MGVNKEHVKSVVNEFMEYFNDYLKDEDEFNDDQEMYEQTIQEEMGAWCCKYCDNQDEVNEALDLIDVELAKAHENWLH